MVRPPPGLATSMKEVASRAVSTATKGGASKLARPALKFQRPIKPQARNASTTSTASSEPTFLQLLYQGVFTSVRSAAIPRPGPYTGQRLAARPPPSPFRKASSGFSSSARARPQPSRFGPTPRPALYPTQTSQLGLGAARKFSSSGYAVFENVVHNAPLALRALADQGSDGLDDRKWRRLRREIRRNEKTDIKGKGAIEGQRFKENVRTEFAQYFSVPAQAVEPVSLLLVLDPEISFGSSSAGPLSRSHDSPSSSAASEFDAGYRLLPPSVLSVFEHYTESYTSHAHRLRSLINRLSAAGLLDDSSLLETGLYSDATTGKRIWKVTFKDAFLTRGRLASILRGDCAAVDELTEWEAKVTSWTGTPRRRLGQGGEGEWWAIEGGDHESLGSLPDCSSVDLDALSDPTPSTYLETPVDSTLFSRRSTSFGSSRADEFTPPTQSLILPDPSSLELSPPLSPSLEPTTWTCPARSAHELEFAFRGPEIEDFDAIDSWSIAYEDEDSSVEEWSSSAGSLLADAEEGGEGEVRQGAEMEVKQFLDEVDRERERVSASWR